MTRRYNRRLYKNWHGRDPRWEESVNSNFASNYGKAGKGTLIVYRADKLIEDGDKGQWENYYHTFSTPCTVWVAGHDGPRYSAGSFPTSLVWLGECLKLEWETPDGYEETVSFGRGRAPLCAMGSRRIAIVDKRDSVVPIILTGLRVTQAGIRDKDDRG